MIVFLLLQEACAQFLVWHLEQLHVMIFNFSFKLFNSRWNWFWWYSSEQKLLLARVPNIFTTLNFLFTDQDMVDKLALNKLEHSFVVVAGERHSADSQLAFLFIRKVYRVVYLLAFSILELGTFIGQSAFNFAYRCAPLVWVNIFCVCNLHNENRMLRKSLINFLGILITLVDSKSERML